MILYDYFRSSASYRVRIALNIKNIYYKKQEVHLVNSGGEQHSEEYKKLNPQKLVPTLVDDNFSISQSMAILEYLEEKYPENPILPEKLEEKALARQIANIICCDIHPLNNLRVLNYLKSDINCSDSEKLNWYKHWITEGFLTIESILEKIDSNDFCIGNYPTIADICLIPQVYNANRFEVNMQQFPRINNINDSCLKIEAFATASP